jgi:DNA polymerase I
MITSHILIIAKKSLNGIENKMNEIERLVNGKDEQTRIVSVEIKDHQAILFIENNGEVIEKVIKNRFYVLVPTSVRGSVKLGGNLYYKYGLQFSKKDEWNKCIQDLRRRRTDLYACFNEKEALLIKNGITYFKGMKHTEPSILSFDIESTGLFHNNDSKVLLISNTYRNQGKVERKLFAYSDFKSQGEMFTAWATWVKVCNPAIICGHNIYSFDLPYINYIAEREGVQLKLGRDDSPLYISAKPSKFRIDGSREQEYHKVKVYGREVIDTYFLAIKHDIAAKKYESYGLKQIIKAEGLEKKDRVHYDSSQIRFNYTDPTEWKKIKEYCIHDADDALAVYDLTAPATFYSTQLCPKPFQTMVESATGSQINVMMIRSYLQDGHSIPKPDQVTSFPGAISRGLPGVYNNCVRWDVASLYPNIMLQYKVYDEDKDPNCNFLKILNELTQKRLYYKQLAKETNDPYYEGLQASTKIFINSFYGFLAASGLHFNSVPCADFVTATGRKILARAIEWATSQSFEDWDKQFNG